MSVPLIADIYEQFGRHLYGNNWASLYRTCKAVRSRLQKQRIRKQQQFLHYEPCGMPKGRAIAFMTCVIYDLPYKLAPADTLTTMQMFISHDSLFARITPQVPSNITRRMHSSVSLGPNFKAIVTRLPFETRQFLAWLTGSIDYISNVVPASMYYMEDDTKCKHVSEAYAYSCDYAKYFLTIAVESEEGVERIKRPLAVLCGVSTATISGKPPEASFIELVTSTHDAELFEGDTEPFEDLIKSYGGSITEHIRRKVYTLALDTGIYISQMCLSEFAMVGLLDRALEQKYYILPDDVLQTDELLKRSKTDWTRTLETCMTREITIYDHDRRHHPELVAALEEMGFVMMSKTEKKYAKH